MKTLLSTDVGDFEDQLTCTGNTLIGIKLCKDDELISLKLDVSSRLDTDSVVTISLNGVNSFGINKLIEELTKVREKLVVLESKNKQ